MTREELMEKPEFEIKLAGAGREEDKEGVFTFHATCSIQIFDMERKCTTKAVSGVVGSGTSVLGAENNAVDRACELLGRS